MEPTRTVPVLILLTSLAGCVAPDGPPGGPEPPTPACRLDAGYTGSVEALIPRHEGTSRVELEGGNLSLTPGTNLTLRAWFFNAGERPFCLLSPCYGYGVTLIRVGSGQLEITDRSGREASAIRTCAPMYRFIEVGPEETFGANLTWDGSFSIRGPAENQTIAYAAAGPWPLEIGFDVAASYDTRRRLTLTVLENDLNRGSTLHPDRCREDVYLWNGC